MLLLNFPIYKSSCQSFYSYMLSISTYLRILSGHLCLIFLTSCACTSYDHETYVYIFQPLYEKGIMTQVSSLSVILSIYLSIDEGHSCPLEGGVAHYWQTSHPLPHRHSFIRVFFTRTERGLHSCTVNVGHMLHIFVTYSTVRPVCINWFTHTTP